MTVTIQAANDSQLPDSGTLEQQLLFRMIGARITSQRCFSLQRQGRLGTMAPIDGAEAYRIGLAQWLVPHGQLMDKAMEIGRDIAALPPLAVRLAKESLTKGLDIPNIRDASEVDIYRFMALSMTEDAADAHAAWREKRTPVVKGR